MHLCYRYARIASCDLLLMLFPMAVRLLGAPRRADVTCREAAVQRVKRNADAPGRYWESGGEVVHWLVAVGLAG